MNWAVSCTGLSPSYSKGKRKHFDCSSSLSKVYSGDRDGPADKRKYSDDTCQVATGLLLFSLYKIDSRSKHFRSVELKVSSRDWIEMQLKYSQRQWFKPKS